MRALLAPGAYPSVRVFENWFLEKFTHAHPLTPLVIWVPVVIFLYWRSISAGELGAGVLVLMGLGGILTWTLTEYLLHRFVFHLRIRGPRADRFQFIIHGLHHQDPLDPTRLVMPPLPGLVLGALFYVLFVGVLGRTLGEPFFASFLIGYLCYDAIHFYVHHFEPRGSIGKFLKQWHMLHHYKNPESRWGVSSPLWDYVFKTR